MIFFLYFWQKDKLIVVRKPYWIPLFTTNFTGVLNDNLLKNLICFISVYWVAKGQASMVITLATGMMVLPYILFSPLAGRLAKRHSKRLIVKYMKLAEMPIMLFAVSGFYFANLYMVIAAMFLMGLQSTIYSPAKYGLIRDIGGEEGISFGTGTVEMLTFLGVLLGSFFAGLLSDVEQYRLLIITAVVMSVALLGYGASLKLKAEESQPDKDDNLSLNPILFIKHMFNWAKKEVKGLNVIVLGLSSFWLIGSLIQMNLLVYCPQELQISNSETGLIMALMAVSVALGCWLAGIISKKTVETGLIPLGGSGLALSILLIVILRPEKLWFVILILLAALSSGFLKVPLNAWIQAQVKGRKLGDAIAYNNLMNFVFILISAALFGWIDVAFGARMVFLTVALLSVILTLVLTIKVADSREKLKNLLKWHKH